MDRHIRRLDDDLAKFEEEQMTGPKMLLTSATTSQTFATSFGPGGVYASNVAASRAHAQQQYQQQENNGVGVSSSSRRSEKRGVSGNMIFFLSLHFLTILKQQ